MSVNRRIATRIPIRGQNGREAGETSPGTRTRAASRSRRYTAAASAPVASANAKTSQRSAVA